jgi:hypothetical protein
MSLQSWLQNSWLVQHEPSAEEVQNLLGISDRDLAACQVQQLPADWRFVRRDFTPYTRSAALCVGVALSHLV